ncbi:hypothetical protein VTI28DRAFT_6001 [Corynascus sepedonium]
MAHVYADHLKRPRPNTKHNHDGVDDGIAINVQLAIDDPIHITKIVNPDKRSSKKRATPPLVVGGADGVRQPAQPTTSTSRTPITILKVCVTPDIAYPDRQQEIFRHRASPLAVRGIGQNIYSTSDYAIIDINFRGTLPSGDDAIATFTREVTIVDDLRAHRLLGMDYMTP